MSKFTKVLLATIIMCGRTNSGQSQEAENSKFRESFNVCVEKAVQVDMNMKLCADAELKYWDNLLTASYRQIMAKESVDAQEKEALRKAQKAWLVFRDYDCEIWNLSGYFGTAGQLNEVMCRLEMTKARTGFMKKFAAAH